MESQNIHNAEKLEFRQIVLKHIQKILEISCKELRNMTYTTHHEHYSTTTEQEDTRHSYIQAIENLAYILIPYFDEKITGVYDECIDVINGLDYEVCEYCKDEYDRICKELNKESLGARFVMEMKLRYAKKMFVALNLLLKRNDYLKSAVYGEDKDELISDEDDGGDSE
jgi:hypothetical protein